MGKLPREPLYKASESVGDWALNFFIALYELFYKVVTNWAFYAGFILAVGTLSRYIFGDDNLIEELSEFLNLCATEEDIDLSPDSIENSDSVLSRIFKFMKDLYKQKLTQG